MSDLPDQMQAVVWEGERRLRLATVETPALQVDTDAIVRVHHASTCGTDLHIYRGAIPGFEAGTVIGHEFVGTVVDVGSAVRRFVPGARVRSSDFVACGECGYCGEGRHPQCGTRRLFGFSGIQPRLDGGMAEYVRVPWADVTLDALPEPIDGRAGLLAADVLPTALGAIQRLSLRPGLRVAVIGAGPVGLLVGFLAQARGAHVLMLESNPHRAAHAQCAGFALLATQSDLVRPDVSFDAAVDAVGGERGLTAALASVRRGGTVVGVGSQAGMFALDWGRIFQSEISLHFVIGNPIAWRGTIEAEMAACSPALDFMFPDRLSGLAEVPAYFDALYRRERFKAIVNIAADHALMFRNPDELAA